MGYPVTVSNIRAAVQRKFPGLPPYALTEASVQRLGVMLNVTRDDRLLRALVQQSHLAEALAAYARGEPMGYLLREAKPWN